MPSTRLTPSNHPSLVKLANQLSAHTESARKSADARKAAAEAGAAQALQLPHPPDQAPARPLLPITPAAQPESGDAPAQGSVARRQPASLSRLPAAVLQSIARDLDSTGASQLLQTDKANRNIVRPIISQKCVNAFDAYWRGEAERELPKLRKFFEGREGVPAPKVAWLGFSEHALEVTSDDDDREFLELATSSPDASLRDYVRGRLEANVRNFDPDDLMSDIKQYRYLLARLYLTSGQHELARGAIWVPHPSKIKLNNIKVGLMAEMVSYSETGNAHQSSAGIKYLLESYYFSKEELSHLAPRIAEAYAWIGDGRNAWVYLEKAMKAGTAELLPVSLFSRNLAHDPLWQQLRESAEQYMSSLKLPPLPKAAA